MPQHILSLLALRSILVTYRADATCNGMPLQRRFLNIPRTLWKKPIKSATPASKYGNVQSAFAAKCGHFRLRPIVQHEALGATLRLNSTLRRDDPDVPSVAVKAAPHT